MTETKEFIEFYGRIGNLYTNAGLSPPFHLKEFVRSWLSDRISREHCIEHVVLPRPARRKPSVRKRR
jgi:hypothetical protein